MVITLKNHPTWFLCHFRCLVNMRAEGIMTGSKVLLGQIGGRLQSSIGICIALLWNTIQLGKEIHIVCKLKTIVQLTLSLANLHYPYIHLYCQCATALRNEVVCFIVLSINSLVVQTIECKW